MNWPEAFVYAVGILGICSAISEVVIHVFDRLEQNEWDKRND